MTEKPSDFYKRLVELTSEKNTKFSAISHSMPFARNLFYEWLRRKSYPNVENLNYLADYYSVSPDYLLGRTDDRN